MNGSCIKKKHISNAPWLLSMEQKPSLSVLFVCDPSVGGGGMQKNKKKCNTSVGGMQKTKIKPLDGWGNVKECMIWAGAAALCNFLV